MKIKEIEMKNFENFNKKPSMKPQSNLTIFTSTNSNFKSKLTEEIKIKNEEEKKIIVGSIDKIYMNIKTVPKYLKILIILVCIITFFNEILFWSIRLTFNSNRQYSYCFDINSNSMKFMEDSKICENFNTNKNVFLYLNQRIWNFN